MSVKTTKHPRRQLTYTNTKTGETRTAHGQEIEPNLIQIDHADWWAFGTDWKLTTPSYEELQATIQRVNDAMKELDKAREQGTVYTYGQIQHRIRKALEGDQ